MIAQLGRDVDSRQQDSLSRCGLRQTVHAEVGVNGEQCGEVAFKGRVLADESSPAEEGLQVRHVRAREGIDFGVVVAESDAIEEEEEDFQGKG